MTNLTKIEKPYGLCSKEQQEGLKALVEIEGALQIMDIISGVWVPRTARYNTAFVRGRVYRQNPDWQPPKLDVPEWFWENTDFNYVAMDKDEAVYAYKCKPEKVSINWSETRPCMRRIDKFFIHHAFNPHIIPWHQSLTIRPGFEE